MKVKINRGTKGRKYFFYIGVVLTVVVFISAIIQFLDKNVMMTLIDLGLTALLAWISWMNYKHKEEEDSETIECKSAEIIQDKPFQPAIPKFPKLPDLPKDVHIGESGDDFDDLEDTPDLEEPEEPEAKFDYNKEEGTVTTNTNIMGKDKSPEEKQDDKLAE